MENAKKQLPKIRDEERESRFGEVFGVSGPVVVSILSLPLLASPRSRGGQGVDGLVTDDWDCVVGTAVDCCEHERGEYVRVGEYHSSLLAETSGEECPPSRQPRWYKWAY